MGAENQRTVRAAGGSFDGRDARRSTSPSSDESSLIVVCRGDVARQFGVLVDARKHIGGIRIRVGPHQPYQRFVAPGVAGDAQRIDEGIALNVFGKPLLIWEEGINELD